MTTAKAGAFFSPRPSVHSMDPSIPMLTPDDRRVLDVLRTQAGADLSKPHMIDHVVVFKMKKQRESGATDLSKEGFSVKLEPHRWGNPWTLVATHELVPSDSNIATAVAKMERLCARMGATYDGWSTAPVR